MKGYFSSLSDKLIHHKRCDKVKTNLETANKNQQPMQTCPECGENTYIVEEKPNHITPYHLSVRRHCTVCGSLWVKHYHFSYNDIDYFIVRGEQNT